MEIGDTEMCLDCNANNLQLWPGGFNAEGSWDAIEALSETGKAYYYFFTSITMAQCIPVPRSYWHLFKSLWLTTCCTHQRREAWWCRRLRRLMSVGRPLPICSLSSKSASTTSPPCSGEEYKLIVIRHARRQHIQISVIIHHTHINQITVNLNYNPVIDLCSSV